jgi:hypothetical protein
LKHVSQSFYDKHGHETFPSLSSHIIPISPPFAVNSYSAMIETLPSVLELADVSFN